jgi:hypothetical protein
VIKQYEYTENVDRYYDCYSKVDVSYKELAMGWTVRGSNPGAGEIFCTHPDQTWIPPSFLYNGYQVIPGVKTAGVWR